MTPTTRSKQAQKPPRPHTSIHASGTGDADVAATGGGALSTGAGAGGAAAGRGAEAVGRGAEAAGGFGRPFGAGESGVLIGVNSLQRAITTRGMPTTWSGGATPRSGRKRLMTHSNPLRPRRSSRLIPHVRRESNRLVRFAPALCVSFAGRRWFAKSGSSADCRPPRSSDGPTFDRTRRAETSSHFGEIRSVVMASANCVKHDRRSPDAKGRSRRHLASGPLEVRGTASDAACEGPSFPVGLKEDFSSDFCRKRLQIAGGFCGEMKVF